jgi:hypothetical protein
MITKMMVVPVIRRPARAIGAVALLLIAAWASDSRAAERRCRGGKQFYSGQCRYPEEIRSLQQQTARGHAAAARRKQEQAAERAQRDRMACEKARAADTVESWEQYAADHPDGECEAEAMGRVTLLRREVAADAPPPEPQPEVGESEPSGALSPLVYVGFGIGAVGFVTWGIAGGISLANRSALSDECPGDVCASDQQDTIDSGEAAGHVATVGMIVGFAGATLGVIGLLLPTGDDQAADVDEATIRPLIGPGTVGLSGRF